MTRVLVAEESRAVRDAVSGQLLGEGYDIVEAADAATVVKVARVEHPDVILLDVDMPTVDGRSVLSVLHQDDRLRDVPVVILSARPGGPEVWDMLRAGAHDELHKPFAPAELSARVAAAARVKSLQDQLRRRNSELDRLSRTDPLTGLYNRRHLDEHLEAAVSAARRHGLAVGVIMCDIDGFKAVNDERGHAVGDGVLTEVANRLQRALRTEDVLGRWGGEEFMVVCPFTDLGGTLSLAERMRSAVAATPVVSGGHESVQVTVSAGCASGTGHDGDALLRAADRALYRAKAAGRNQVVAAEV